MSKTIIVSGSNSSKSINREVAQQLSKKTGWALIELADYDIPFYCSDREQRKEWKDLAKLESELAKAEKLVFFLPEHNGNLPAFAKSCFDWLSRKKDVHERGVLFGRKAYLACVSPGQTGGESIRKIFTELMPWIGLQVIGTHGVGGYASGTNVDSHLDAIAKEVGA